MSVLLLEAAGKPLGVLLVQALQLEARIDTLLDGLPKSLAFGYRSMTHRVVRSTFVGRHPMVARRAERRILPA